MKMNRFKNDKYNKMAAVPHKFSAETNEETSTSTITIYGDIGESWWGDATSASDIDNALKNITSDEIVVRLNSPGGSAFDGIAIYNQLKSHSAKVKIYVDGWACSAASVIAMAADELIMNTGSMLMIHGASTIVWGTKEDFEKEAVVLGKLNESIIDIYMTRYNKERSEIETLVSDETWFTAKEAAEIGFADVVKEESSTDAELKAVIAQLKSDISTLQSKVIDPAIVPAAKVRSNFANLFTKLN